MKAWLGLTGAAREQGSVQDRFDYHGLRVFWEAESGRGRALPAATTFHAQVGQSAYLQPPSIVYTLRIQVSPDYVPWGWHQGQSPSDFAHSHGLEHVKALIDMDVEHGRDYVESWDIDHEEGGLDKALDDSTVRITLLNALRHVSHAVARSGDTSQLSLEGMACVLGGTEDRLQRALLDLRTLELVIDLKNLPADSRGILDGYCAITKEGLRYLEETARQPATRTRAVLFADLVSSTAMNARLGDRAWASKSTAFLSQGIAIVGRHGGEVPKTDGDRIMALFPSATSALDAALDLIEQTQGDQLSLKVGVHLGEVTESAPGSSDPAQGMAVNTASRIEDQASGGDVLTSETAMRAARESGAPFTFEPAGTPQLKGVPESPPLYRVVRGQPRSADA